MEIRIRGSGLHQALLEEVGRLGDHALVWTDEVVHDAATGTVTFTIERRPVGGKSLLGATKHDGALVRTRVVIRNATGCQVERLSGDRFMATILFGLKIGKDGVYMCSAEEEQGRHLFSMDCQVSELDLDLVDE